jgi:hypothetical protein
MLPPPQHAAGISQLLLLLSRLPLLAPVLLLLLACLISTEWLVEAATDPYVRTVTKAPASSNLEMHTLAGESCFNGSGSWLHVLFCCTAAVPQAAVSCCCRREQATTRELCYNLPTSIFAGSSLLMGVLLARLPQGGEHQNSRDD